MNRFLICIYLIISVMTTNAQPLSKRHRLQYGCVITNRLPLASRLKKYPFNKAAKIVLVSFPFWTEGSEEATIVDSLNKSATSIGVTDTRQDTCFNGNLNIFDSVLNYSSLIEVTTLNRNQINKLSALFFNINTRNRKKYINIGYACYAPRNAILFYDKSGKIFDYLEICFECQQMRSQSDDIYFTKDCFDLMDVMKQFFINAGIKYGTLYY